MFGFDMNIHFVLSHPAVPENIGFVSRALKTMGFGSLRLVNPAGHLSQQAKKTAYGSHDILENALVYGSLGGAIAGADLVIGTTAKKRLARHDYYSPEQLADILQQKREVVNDVAIVFGSERDGLSGDEIGQCDLLSTIPLATAYPSLNLAQSVLIYAWELSKKSLCEPLASDTGTSTQAELKKALQILSDLDVARQPSLYHRLKDRIMSAAAEDTRLMLSFARFLRQKLKERKQ